MSFQTLYSQAQSLCSDATSGTLTLLKNLINQTQGNLLAWRKDITETSATDTTVASQQNYYLPYNYGKMIRPTITVSSIAYPVKELEDNNLWFELNARSTSVKSDIPQFYRIFNDQIYFYPTPSSSGNTITFYYHKIVRDMIFADYTTGTVDIITNAATAVTGSGTTWTSPMIGRFIRVTPSNTATASGDGYWYEISTRTSNTVIGLKKNYNGSSLTAGAAAAYTIGEMPIIPENYHDMLVWRPVAIYWQMKGDIKKADYYWNLFDGGYSTGKREKPGGMLDQFINDRSSKVDSAIIDPEQAWVRRGVELRNPNDYPLNLS